MDLTYRSPKTEVRPSPIQGRGLFAARPIARGEIVAVKGGHVLTRAQWTALERDLGPAEIQLTEDLVIALENYLAQLGAWVTVVQGAIFVVCVLTFRRGVVGELARLIRRPL